MAIGDYYGNHSLVDHPCGKRPRCSGCSKELTGFEEHIVALRGQDGRAHVAPGVWCLPCSTKEDERLNRPILGHDRNGREVRRGHTLKTVSGSFVADSWDFGRFVSAYRSHVVAAQYCELVTDEKAEQTVCQHCGGDDTGHSVRCLLVRGYIGSQGALNTPENQAAGDALESLCRALAQPTKGERFAAFRERISWTLLHERADAVEAIYDVRDGVPFVMLEFQGLRTTIWDKPRDIECLMNWLQYCTETAGRAILRGGK